MKEQELLKNLRNKETRNRAFSELVSQYSEKLYWTVRHIVGTHDDADDVIQNTFIKAWSKHWTTYAGIKNMPQQM